MLTRLNEAVSIIDTEALGAPNVVAAYLVTGKETALIDMGYESSAQLVIEDVANFGAGPNGLDYLLPTHVHLDHSGSCGTLAKRFVTATILVHPKGQPHLAAPDRLWKGAGQLFGDDLMARYGRPEPIEQKRLRIASDDEVVDLGGGVRLRTLWTPGHASHHLSYEWEGHRAFFTGDAVGVYYPDFSTLLPTTPPTSFNLEQTLRSLERIRENSPSKFYTPHYGVVKDATHWIGENVKALLHWSDFIKSRIARGLSEEEIAKALTDDACRNTGRPFSEVPDYALVSIKISALGFLRYLKEHELMG